LTAREWSAEVKAEWDRLYAVHDDGDRDEMMRMALEELLSLRFALRWISSHSSEVANLQAYAQIALGTHPMFQEPPFQPKTVPGEPGMERK
jgi:hypothetical protein